MGNIEYTGATDAEIIEDLGKRLEALRESRKLNKCEAAERAGLSRRTLYGAEGGENFTINTLIRLLRVYGRLAALEDFIPPPMVSPMNILRERRKDEEVGG